MAIWVVNIQVCGYVGFTKPYVNGFVLYFKKEKKKSLLRGRKKKIAISGARLTVLDLRLDNFLLCDLRQVT